MKKLAREVCIIGVGMHKFGKFLDKSLKDLTRVAVWNAIHDAGIDAKQIEAAYFSNVLAGLITGQESIRGQVFLRDAGFEGLPIVNVEGACASGAIALREAMITVGAGVYDMVLAVGAEKLYLDDTARSIAAMAANTDVEFMAGLGFQFTGSYAMTLRKYMQQYGWTQEHFARVASKNKYNGSLNPYAQYQKPMSVEEILSSRVIAWPLTLYMCATMGDGAAAAIVCSQEMARKIGGKLPVTIATCCLRSGEVTGEDDGQRGIAREAYDTAGLGPPDIEVAEVHDAMAPGEMFRIEKLGFCRAEEMGQLIDQGYFSLTGKLPVNTSGGLAARGHPIGATGLAQIAELVWQLRGEAGARQVKGRNSLYPRVGLAQNSGGYVEGSPAALTVTILKRDVA
ncbi:MAG: thiolase family protein [Dehalococcoidales bacterium]|nr:thiolase family protein [Dehalococcoidales bacterium]